MALPPLSQKLTEDEKEKAVLFAEWLRSSVNLKDPSPTELDAYNLYRWTLELIEELFRKEEAWDEKP